MDSFLIRKNLTGLTGLLRLFLFFLTSRMEVRKPNPPPAEKYSTFCNRFPVFSLYFHPGGPKVD
jgi:hypothetical protein